MSPRRVWIKAESLLYRVEELAVLVGSPERVVVFWNGEYDAYGVSVFVVKSFMNTLPSLSGPG